MFRRSNRSNQNNKVSTSMVNCIAKSDMKQSPPLSTTSPYPESCQRSSSPSCVVVDCNSVQSSKEQPTHTTDSVPDPFEQFYDKLEAAMCNQLPKEADQRIGQPVHLRPHSIRVSRTECEQVARHYFALRSVPLTERQQHSIVSHTFNHWLYSDAQLLQCLKFMFVDLDLPTACRFPIELLEAWLLAVYARYNDVPFHNFKHAFAVTQMMYSIIKQAHLTVHFSALDLFVLLFSALCHDLDHPGFTNSYQVNAHSWLALRYNDNSPLENHHCATAFELVQSPATNILCGLSATEWCWFRKAVIKCILATDMATHNECTQQFHQLLPKLVEAVCSLASSNSKDLTSLGRFLDDNPESRLTVMLILLKICDISNEMRPAAVSDPWLGCLLEEFFYQANAERKTGLPVAPHMDPEKVTRSTSQVGFLNGVLIPMLKDVTQVFPQLQPLLVATQERVAHYSRLGEEQQQQPTESKRTAPSICTTDVPAPKLPSPLKRFSTPSTSSTTAADTLSRGDLMTRGTRLIYDSPTLPVTVQAVAPKRQSGRVMDIDVDLSGTSNTAPTPQQPPFPSPTRTRLSHAEASNYLIVDAHSPEVPLCSLDADCSGGDLTQWSPDNAPSRKSSTGSMVLANS